MFYREVEENFLDWGGVFSPRAWELTNPLLQELSRLSERHRFQLVWLAFPTRQQVEADFDASEPQQRLAREAKRLGVPLLDLLPVLRNLRSEIEGPVFFDHCHHTPEASRALAEAIFAWLKETDDQ